MSIQDIVQLFLKISLLLMVFSLGLGTRIEDLIYLARRPRLLIRSLLVINVIVPLVGAGLISLFPLPMEVKIAVITLSVSPLPPLMPRKAVRSGGDGSYGMGLLLVVAVVLVPVSVTVLGKVFGRDAGISWLKVAIIMAQAVLAPVLAGVAVARFVPKIAAFIDRPIRIAAPFLLFLALVPVMVKLGPTVLALIGTGAFLALSAFILAGIGAGHLMGGPAPADRAVLALAAASRHPGIAMAIAAANFPNAKSATAVIILYLVLNTFVAFPYAWICRRVYGAQAEV